ncbi:hypothetical protein [Microbulbifer spongiae]|uniref:TonB C-terminal domain-containing protein n=1 Tax=Microbulbifer spongiae TaxID=2944933 RepID=A0ABY9EBS8_9GAMM|nr:hypothetical protein [Microbulbifer sp. MI-G]WKD49612.1 hypothetical protein M8T91_17245 [Microbulbifer sp. MI-G]
MIGTISTFLVFLSFKNPGEEDIPVWQYTIPGSSYIQGQYSEETNPIIARVSFSKEGDVLAIDFLRKSTLPELNEEAKQNILNESPFPEFSDMSEEEKNHQLVKMIYAVPCKSP